MTIKFKGQGVVVLGGQWGDEGKGRIVDSLAEQCDVIVRFQGGNNAGHSLHIGDKSIVLHLIPCGIMRPEKVCIIGNGVVIDPEVLQVEIGKLASLGVMCQANNLKISRHAHIIFPYHRLIDQDREAQSDGRIGTTKRGIGPCYEDKIARFGIMAQDLRSEDIMRTKLTTVLANRPELSKQSIHELIDFGLRSGKHLEPFLCDVGDVLQDLLKQGKRVLFEGAQGSLLDVDHGTYPFVTSSNCVAAQAAIGSGIGPQWLSDIFMVTKAYTTRVGGGPFFTEADEETQTKIRHVGQEFGATTGRARRCGWLDLEALRYAARLNGARGLIVTKADVLVGVGPIKVGVGYKDQGARKLSFTEAMYQNLQNDPFEVDYVELPELSAMPDTIRGMRDLPKTLQDLFSIMEKVLGIPILLVSYGPKRGQEFIVAQ